MVAGSLYQLGVPTLGFRTDEDKKRVPVMVPAEVSLRIHTVETPMAVVEWEGKLVTLFAVDILERGTLVSGELV